MNHCWHMHPEHHRPLRYCCRCNDHQDGIWYLDHLVDVWLVQWDNDAPLCRVIPSFDGVPGEAARRAKWQLN